MTTTAGLDREMTMTTPDQVMAMMTATTTTVVPETEAMTIQTTTTD
jgi:hypothetical protein